MRQPKLTVFPIPMPRWERLTADLSDRDTRALWRLVAFYGSEGGLPLDDTALAQIARVDLRTWRSRLRGLLAARFPVEGFRWPEIDGQIERRQKILLKRSAAGIAGNAKRWGGLRTTDSAAIAPPLARP